MTHDGVLFTIHIIQTRANAGSLSANAGDIKDSLQCPFVVQRKVFILKAKNIEIQQKLNKYNMLDTQSHNERELERL